MTKKIFRSILAVAGTVLLASLLVIMGCLYEYFGSVEKKQLHDELALAAAAVEANGTDYLEKLSSGHYRLTWIAPDGAVIFDTETDAESLENHADREEVKRAFEYGEGESSRYSSTLLQKTMYSAQKLSDGSVLRISISRATAGVLLVGMIQPILVVLIVALILSGVLAKSLSRRIVRPLNELDLEHPLENDAYEELAPLLGRINRQHRQIDEQMDELQRRQAEFDDITARMDEGLVLFSGKGMILFANHAARALFPHDSAEGSYLTLCRDANYIQVVEQALDGKGAHGKLERNGRIYELTASSVEENSAWHAAVLLIVDITERERAEQQRQEFTANVSHELKTPLTSIMGYAEIIAGGIAKPEDVAPFAGKIRTEAQRLLALIEDIIHLSRLDEGGETVAFEPVELSALCDTVRDRLQSKAAGKGIALRIEGEPAAVSGQRRTLEQMIFNLTDNAINYNKPQGSVTLTTGTESGRPFVQVSDTGIGIAPADQQRVFERFYRVDKSHSKMTGGTGLGLSIVKHGAALHHAEVELKSALGEGTCITLRFPKE